MPDQEPQAALGALLFERAPCKVVVVDADHRIVLHNCAFGEAFGALDGELCYRALKGRDAPCPDCQAEQALRSGEERRQEQQVRDGAGREVCLQVQAIPVETAPGQPGRVLQVCHDTTEVRELERALSEAERLASVGLTTAGLAHSIKNILAGLEGGVYVVSSGLERDDGERLRAGWGMVQEYIQQVTKLVRNLLRYAREGEPVREPVDPTALVRRVYELYATKAELAGAELVQQVEGELPQLSGAEEQLNGCLANLVTNAMDACSMDPAEGKQHRIVLGARPAAQGGVTFWVEDNGMGVSEEDKAKLMARIFTSKGIRGTGLGLLMTRKAVEAHGGEMSFESQRGQGTTFCIWLPAAEGDASGN